MKKLQKPISEGEVLRSVMLDTSPGEVLDSLHQKTECRVDHLCGCSSVPLPSEPTKSKSPERSVQES